MNHEAPEHGYMGLKTLAVYSGLSVRTLRTHLVDAIRPLPHYRVGGRILVRRSDFDVWASQFKVAAPVVGIDTIVDDLLRGLR
jgi:hypothetical protein